MNEIERLLHEGMISEDFLKEEVRCDYTITSSMKKIWAIELDLLIVFDKVCKKHGLKYYAIGGSLLGAARHQGIIPWDDDIDVMMMREDYDKLCEIAPQEFKQPYFFQTNYTDFGAYWGHAKLMNCNTTCILKLDRNHKRDVTQGIFLDIFPEDNVVNDERLFNKQRKRAEFYRLWSKRFANATKKANRLTPHRWVNIFYSFLASFASPINYRISIFLWRLFEKECKRYNHQETEFISQLSFQFTKRWAQKKEDYKDVVFLPFEFTKIPVCINFDHALSMLFGDWHKFVRGDSQHEGLFFDTDHPYPEYFKDIKYEK